MTITPEQFNNLATRDDVEEIVEEKITKFKDKILTGQDKLMKKLDTEFWFSLKGSITKRLYRYLDKHFYWSPIYTIGLRELAFNHLGMPKTYYPKDIKRKLDPACDQLVQRGYLEKYYYQEGEKRKEEIVFVKSVQLELPMPKERKSETLLLKQGDSLVAELVQRGITKTTAGKLCQKYNQDRVKEKIELLDYLKETDSPLVEKNPAGYLRKAIKEDYQPPQGFTTKAQREEKNKVERFGSFGNIPLIGHEAKGMAQWMKPWRETSITGCSLSFV